MFVKILQNYRAKCTMCTFPNGGNNNLWLFAYVTHWQWWCIVYIPVLFIFSHIVFLGPLSMTEHLPHEHMQDTVPPGVPTTNLSRCCSGIITSVFYLGWWICKQRHVSKRERAILKSSCLRWVFSSPARCWWSQLRRGNSWTSKNEKWCQLHERPKKVQTPILRRFTKG